MGLHRRLGSVRGRNPGWAKVGAKGRELELPRPTTKESQSQDQGDTFLDNGTGELQLTLAGHLLLGIHTGIQPNSWSLGCAGARDTQEPGMRRRAYRTLGGPGKIRV